MQIPVIDLFAGPGGLAEGFSSAQIAGARPFKVKLSIEKDPIAHRTLELRSFYRQFEPNQIPSDYFAYLRGELSRGQLFEKHPDAASRAKEEAWCATLGGESPDEVYRRIKSALGGAESWVLIGGPPCQAYSLVGRSRMKGFGKRFEKDPRHFLYLEYLQIIGDHWPTVFVMENVKGILSSKVNDSLIFDRIRNDLENPADALKEEGRERRSGKRKYTYHLVALTAPPREEEESYESSDFLIRAEQHGIPQARHRVIIVGVRSDWWDRLPSMHLAPRTTAPPTVAAAIAGLPPVRSGLSRKDSLEKWKANLETALERSWFERSAVELQNVIREAITNATAASWDFERGAEFIAEAAPPDAQLDFLHAQNMSGCCNHTARSHIPADILRYLYAAAFAKANSRSPKIADFPAALRPKHANVEAATEGKMFSDRFRVQLPDGPATTVTSHISKDGHYFIHPDPAQARSLTVREAARLQTFPDDYFFEGPRTAQYHQVGNAVPPALARQIGETVAGALLASQRPLKVAG